MPAATEVIPVSGTAIEAAPQAKPKKRHRVRTIIILVAVLAVLVVAFFVADGFAKRFATDYVKDSIVSVLHIDPKTPVKVDLGGGSIILQAITGGIRTVTIDIQSLSFGELTGAAHIVATNVPLDSAKPLDTLGIRFTIGQDNVRTLGKYLSGLDLKQIDVGKGVIRIGSEFTVLFFTIPVSVDLEPSAQDGGIAFEPKTVILAGNEISVADLRANPQFRALAGDLLNSQQVCVADFLPKALTITDVHVSQSNLVVTIKGDGTALGGPGLSTLGSCPAAK